MITDSAGNQGPTGGSFVGFGYSGSDSSIAINCPLPRRTVLIRQKKWREVSVLVDLTGTGAVAGDKLGVQLALHLFPTAVVCKF